LTQIDCSDLINERVITSIPCYFDGKFLPKAVDGAYRLLNRFCNNFIVSIVEDVSDSSKIVDELKKKYPNLTYSRSNLRHGRGSSVTNSWLRTQADVYMFMDADMATEMETFDAFRRLLMNVAKGRCDFATGSRYVPGAIVHRPLLRLILSRIYNLVVGKLFKTGVHDHQCGFKAFSKAVVENVLATTQEGKYTAEKKYLGAGYWDTEIIVAAKKKGYRILEIPVAWTEKKKDTVAAGRLIKDIKYGIPEMVLLLRKVRKKSFKPA